MTKELLIEHTIKVISQLPTEKVSEISDFADFIYVKYEEELLSDNMHKLLMNGKSFDFLKDEEDLYTVNDLKEKF